MNTRYNLPFALILLIQSWLPAFAGQYVPISADLEIYYEEAGTGRPLVFVTGWTGTGEFFAAHQIPYFSSNYRVLAYDPRSQGRSSKTLEGHTYLQHGKDLRAFMEALKLKDVMVVGWSSGCQDIYAYFRTYGTDNISAFACIDQPPRPVPAQKGDWAEFADAAQVGDFLNAVTYDRRKLMNDFIPTMMQRQMTEDEKAWALDQTQKTPNYVAVLLGVDHAFGDYTEEAKKIDGKIPVLNILSESQAGAGTAWLARNAPHSEISVLGNHMMFREHPGAFNDALGAFLAKQK